MSTKYDEDLYENQFFITIQTRHKELLDKCAKNGWVLCIPKFILTCNSIITDKDVADHLLQPIERKDTDVIINFISLSEKEAKIENGLVKLDKGFPIRKEVKVLFEETFHNDQDDSFRVICVENFFNKEDKESDTNDARNRYFSRPSTYEECLDILWSHPGGKKTRDNLDKTLSPFADSYDRLEGENIRNIADVSASQFTKAMQIVLKDSFVKRSVKLNPAYIDNIKVSVEAYLMNSIHKKLFRVITACLSGEDAEINKLTRNLVDLQLQDMGIREIFSKNISPAKKELSKLNQFSTPVGRLFCIKRVVAVLTRPPKQSNSSSEDHLMTTDDFLPILIFLIIKSEIPNWMANLTYMQHFHPAKVNSDDEYGFYLASIEAALEHIKSGKIKDEVITKDKLMFEHCKPMTLTETNKDGAIQRPVSANPSIIDEFFKNVRNGNEAAVLSMLDNRCTEEIYLKLCHPLCSCDNCDKLLSKNRRDSNLVTAYTRDDRGYTALHIACYYGQACLIDVLVKYGAVVDATDYLGLTPLHIACQKGFQNVMLLLLHFDADASAPDNDGNTPLHLAAANGHEDCVKGMVFYDVKRIQLDTVNDIGNTALHMAAKWGYDIIVKTLLENGADAMVKNRKKQTPIHLAQNIIVQRQLMDMAGINLQLKTQKDIELKFKKTKPSSILKSSSSSSFKSLDTQEYTPTSYTTGTLDPSPSKVKKQRDKLFKAITSGDIQLVMYYLGLDGNGEKSSDDEDDDEYMTSSTNKLCHPLCSCSKCSHLQKNGGKTWSNNLVNIQSRTGYTPLHLAVMNSHYDMVELLVKQGAVVNMCNHKSLTPLHLVSFLQDKQEYHEAKIAKLLLEHGASVNEKDNNGDTPLIVSCANDFIGGVHLFIKFHANLDQCNLKGNTALHLGVEREHDDIVKLLLESNANPLLTNSAGKSVLELSKDTRLYPVVSHYSKQRQQDDSKTDSIDTVHQIGIKELFAAFEEKDLKTLTEISASIKKFDSHRKLRRASTKDLSQPLLDENLARCLSIQHFDPGSLNHVDMVVDKSEPLYIYSLSKADLTHVSSVSGSEDFISPELDIKSDANAELLHHKTSSNNHKICKVNTGSNSELSEDMSSLQVNIEVSEKMFMNVEPGNNLCGTDQTTSRPKVITNEPGSESTSNMTGKQSCGKIPGDKSSPDSVIKCESQLKTYITDDHQLFQKETTKDIEICDANKTGSEIEISNSVSMKTKSDISCSLNCDSGADVTDLLTSEKQIKHPEDDSKIHSTSTNDASFAESDTKNVCDQETGISDKYSESGFTEISDSEGCSTSRDLDNESLLSFN